MAFPFLALIPVIGELLNKILPDTAAKDAAKAELARMAVEGEFKYLEADLQLALAQIGVNKAEAEQPGTFKGGWRPAAAWACVFAGIVYPILRTLLPWGLKVAGIEGVPPLPALDTTEAMTMLFGLLGLGGMRMAERLKGKA
jgi:hypothetical protein